jgi:SAM-dependent methyltransferase
MGCERAAVPAATARMTSPARLKVRIRSRLPGPLRRWYWRWVETRWRRRSRQAVFSEIYRGHFWGGGMNPSGGGSSLASTRAIRAALPHLVSELGVSSVLDVACGTFVWQSHLELPVEMIGGDIVPEIVARLQDRFGNERRRFVHLDVTSDALPRVDMILCRDCLVHLDLEAARRALDNMLDAGARYLVLTTFPAVERNSEIVSGFFRTLNMCLPPFDLPTPLRLVREDYPEKCLGVWDVRDVSADRR